MAIRDVDQQADIPIVMIIMVNLCADSVLNLGICVLLSCLSGFIIFIVLIITQPGFG
jgi:hypothetical protein